MVLDEITSILSKLMETSRKNEMNFDIIENIAILL